MQLVSETTSARLQGLLVRLICCLATEYWLDSQCFENFFTSQLGALQQQSATVARLLLKEILATMKVLVGSCKTDNAEFDDSEEAGSGSTPSTASQPDSLSHKSFKTVQLFKSSALLTIFELVNISFAA